LLIFPRPPAAGQAVFFLSGLIGLLRPARKKNGAAEAAPFE